MNIRVPIAAIEAADEALAILSPELPMSRSKLITAAIWIGLSVMRKEHYRRHNIYAAADGVTGR